VQTTDDGRLPNKL